MPGTQTRCWKCAVERCTIEVASEPMQDTDANDKEWSANLMRWVCTRKDCNGCWFGQPREQGEQLQVERDKDHYDVSDEKPRKIMVAKYQIPACTNSRYTKTQYKEWRDKEWFTKRQWYPEWEDKPQELSPWWFNRCHECKGEFRPLEDMIIFTQPGKILSMSDWTKFRHHVMGISDTASLMSGASGSSGVSGISTYHELSAYIYQEAHNAGSRKRVRGGRKNWDHP